MSEGFQVTQTDQRTLGSLIARLIDDLNKPDLQAQAADYTKDAIRYYQRKPFFFNDTDNSPVALYANSTTYPQGSLIQVNIGGTLYAVCALNAGISWASGTPAFPTSIFTPPGGAPPPPIGTIGTVVDPGGPPQIMWATVGLWSQTTWTQLSTVYQINQYVPPLDYVSPERIEVTAANLRYELHSISYGQLRNYDVIRPGPITTYPTMWAWFQQQIYVWPYPNGFYPLTLSYRSAPPLVTNMGDSNFWTQQAEALIRAKAAQLMCLNLIHDPEAAADFLAVVKAEEAALKSQGIAQNNPASSGIPGHDW